MVNKVNGNEYYDYSKRKIPDAAEKPENGEKFSLNYQRAKEEPEKKAEKEQDGAHIGTAGRRTLLQGGVRLELSGNDRAAAEPENAPAGRKRAGGRVIIDAVRSYAAVILQAVKTFFYKVWNDESKQETEQAGEAEQEEKLSEEYLALHPREERGEAAQTALPFAKPAQTDTEKEKEIRKYLYSGNLEQVMSLLTENGHKTMAKNSTLLTYYDRNGRITPISASDQERILHGDRNVRKL